MGLTVLVFGALAAGGAALLAMRAPALHEAARAIGNGFAIVGVHRIWFARWRWGFVAILTLVLLLVCLKLAVPLSLGLIAVARIIGVAFEVLELVAIPFEIAHIFGETRHYPTSESFRLVRARPSRKA